MEFVFQFSAHPSACKRKFVVWVCWPAHVFIVTNEIALGLLAHVYGNDLQIYCHMNVGSEPTVLGVKNLLLLFICFFTSRHKTNILLHLRGPQMIPMIVEKIILLNSI